MTYPGLQFSKLYTFPNGVMAIVKNVLLMSQLAETLMDTQI